jgi:hypothetical protein
MIAIPAHSVAVDAADDEHVFAVRIPDPQRDDRPPLHRATDLNRRDGDHQPHERDGEPRDHPTAQTAWRRSSEPPSPTASPPVPGHRLGLNPNARAGTRQSADGVDLARTGRQSGSRVASRGTSSTTGRIRSRSGRRGSPATPSSASRRSRSGTASTRTSPRPGARAGSLAPLLACRHCRQLAEPPFSAGGGVHSRAVGRLVDARPARRSK